MLSRMRLHRMRWVLPVLVLLVMPVSALAQGPIMPEHTQATWEAAYWANMSLSGDPVLTREEENLNYNWGAGSPHDLVPDDGFSARWLRYISVTPGTYRFSVTSDDGVRLWVDDELILDMWYDHAAETRFVDHYLSAGHHLVRVEYYENTGLATVQVSWVRSDQAAGAWRAEYFNNVTLSGSPALVRNEAAIDFDWGTNSPDPAVVNSNYFSARWTRTMEFPADMYRFSVTVDDGARLWVNGHLLIDAWYEQAATTYTGEIYLSGSTTIELQYYENTGFAVAQLDWEPPVSGVPTPQTVVVDDLSPGFAQGGAAGSWRTASEGYEGHLTWTYNNDQVRANYNWARWYPTLAGGRYEVFVYIPNRYSTTAQARYWVSHADGLKLRVVDQSANGGSWVSLGTYEFRGDNSGYVSLADVTFEPRLSRIVAFDAVRWEPR